MHIKSMIDTVIFSNKALIHLYEFMRVSPHLLDVAVFSTQEASQQLHDIIFEMITLQPVEEMSFL